jgi:hypothetical protein
MVNIKKFIGYTTTAKTVYGIVERQVDSYGLNDADGTFASAPADPYVSFAEHSVIKGEYDLSENRTAWNDGLYKCTIYEQSGGSPAPVSDTVIAYQYMYIVSDLEVVSESKIPNLDVAISTRLAPAGTLTTVTNLTNAPTVGDFTATMKTSLNAATPTSVQNISAQTGDGYARLGAPAGASISADIAAVKVDSAAIKLQTDALPSGIAKNVALSNFQFFMVLSSDHVSAAGGKTVTGTISKDGGAFAALTNAVSEIGNGMYKVNITQIEMNADVVTLKFTETNCDQRIITVYTT